MPEHGRRDGDVSCVSEPSPFSSSSFSCSASGSGDDSGGASGGGPHSGPASVTRRRLRRAERLADVVLDRYELLEEIGSGGFGTVYRALDRITRRHVAVKIVPMGSALLEAWHAREVASLRRARIPGVAELLETGEMAGWAIIVMGLVEGSPFPGADASPQQWQLVVNRGVALLEAVSQLHALGILHRDLKPGNVLVSADGTLTVVDMGIAEDASDAERAALDGAPLGTRSYMAPERLRGEPATPRSELYSIGVMLLDALDGRRPGEIIVDDPGLESSPTPFASVPREVALLIRSMAAPDATRRPADAKAVLDALRPLLGTTEELELPWLGDTRAVEALVEAGREGRSLNVTGAAGSGRTRALREAAARLGAEGWAVEWFRRGELPAEAPAWLPALRQRLAEGLILLVDDFDALAAADRALLDELRALGSLLCASSESRAGGAVLLRELSEADLARVIAGPERLVHVPSEAARLLWQRTRGRPREIVREIQTWQATGLASWHDTLVIRPGALDRLRSMAPATASREEMGSSLDDTARAAWSVLTLLATPIRAAAVAAVLELPRGEVASAIARLAHAGLVHADAAGLVEIVRASPDLVAIDAVTRRAWCARAAAHLPEASEARFEHVLASGDHQAACELAVEVGAKLLREAAIPAALAVLDRALTAARRHLPQAEDLHADLLAVHAEAALARATPDAIDLALYHVNLSPIQGERVRAWSRILGAAASLLGGDARGALGRLHGTEGLPTHAHRRAAHVVAFFAARFAGLDAMRERTREVARWARQKRDADARSLLATTMGWLRYEEGRYEIAARLHARAARATLHERSKTTALCNAAMAALEAGALDEARQLATAALRSARATSDHVNDARAELALRQAAYRSRDSGGADEELLEGAESLEPGVLRGTLLLTESAFAWRHRRIARAAELALRAANDLGASMPEAATLARAHAANCGNVDRPALAADLRALTTCTRPGLKAQSVALAALMLGDEGMSGDLVHEARRWAEQAACPDMPREVLSPSEVLARLRPFTTKT